MVQVCKHQYNIILYINLKLSTFPRISCCRKGQVCVYFTDFPINVTCCLLIHNYWFHFVCFHVYDCSEGHCHSFNLLANLLYWEIETCWNVLTSISKYTHVTEFKLFNSNLFSVWADIPSTTVSNGEVIFMAG